MRNRMIGAAVAAALLLFAAPAFAAEEGADLQTRQWSFGGNFWSSVFGTYDRDQLRRGYQVYSEVCSSCHSLRLVAYRNLSALGLTEDEIKDIAAEHEVPAGPNEEGETTDENGELLMRTALPSDRFVAPFANDLAARAANNGALPPDLSLITKARKGGPDYIFSLLVGYSEEPPEDIELQDGMNYNVYFPGNQIAMAPPLTEDAVEYADGTAASVEQLSQDVTAFLNWAAEPELGERKRLGVKVMLFLIVLTALLYALKRRVWADAH